MEKSEWYLPDMNGPDPIGPYSFDDIVAKLEAGEINPATFVWGSHFTEQKWARILETPEFAKYAGSYPKCKTPKKRGKGSSERAVAKLDFSKTTGEYGIENEYRRFPRAPMKCDIIVHDQKTFLKCESVDISEKGVSVLTDDNLRFAAGDEVIVTILDTPYAGTFSVRAIVMRSLDRPFRGFGFYFLTISPMIKRKMAQYIIQKLGANQDKGIGAA